ncbi:SpoVR-like family protein [Desulfamplus magnetovallimortis]|uniref:SpoVR-like family protein n=1 Tax=Desulfamplus magnetovallimortis TaxID=1246637 RepID=A0A1W1HKV1_9BACT|nr:SpoVR family protein [Desulfamplus magnetovallimortis]SLM33083.1 SpoVR-like family protein [Desulfamplus magnetovallimortis]
MQLIDQHVKGIMEGCKQRARDAGLSFEDESLEYIVTNRDMIELSPKVMIPTLYDYWVHDVRVISGQGMYELYPSNPYETVINTRPPISYYNDNNPDWLNVMIFYHVLGHIDFFQNNLFFKHTWDFDFNGQALADKRLIAKYRSEKGRWVDYVIEFSRAIDNLVGYHDHVAGTLRSEGKRALGKLDYYFDIFLQNEKKVIQSEYLKEIDRYNKIDHNRLEVVGKDATSQENHENGAYAANAHDKNITHDTNHGAAVDLNHIYESNGSLSGTKNGNISKEDLFLIDVRIKYPEFDSFYSRYIEKKEKSRLDVVQYILKNSEFLKKDENRWMKSVIEIIRNTSLVFQPQIRTKIMNEGWASIWHEMLFMQDDRIKGHETDFAKVNAGVTSMPKVGLNPYALGMRLFYHIMEMENRDCYSFEYFNLKDKVKRDKFDKSKKDNPGKKGLEKIFQIRENLNDFTFINSFIDQEFMDKHNLFVSGKRLNRERMSWQYYVKSRKAEDYRDMIINTLYHPPVIYVDHKKTTQGPLYLVHKFEGKPLKRDYIENTMVGIEYLWGRSVRLETSEPVAASAETPHQRFINFWNQPKPPSPSAAQPDNKKEITWKRVLYVMENRKLIKRDI